MVLVSPVTGYGELLGYFDACLFMGKISPGLYGVVFVLFDAPIITMDLSLTLS